MTWCHKHNRNDCAVCDAELIVDSNKRVVKAVEETRHQIRIANNRLLLLLFIWMLVDLIAQACS